MKIKTKIKYNTLETLCRLYDNVCRWEQTNPSEYQFSKEYRMIKNSIDLLFVKLKKKLLEKQHETKPFSVSFDYYQAYFLVQFMQNNVGGFIDHLGRNLIYALIMKLDQQL